MKLLFACVLLVVALQNGTGAPRKARYKYVKCNPKGGEENCVTYQSAEINWTPDLPAKLQASTVEYLEGNAVKGENQPEDKMDLLVEDGSGTDKGFEKESTENLGFFTVEPETGSGSKEYYIDIPAEKELKEDDLLKL